jgi:hypothetical protein
VVEVVFSLRVGAPSPPYLWMWEVVMGAQVVTVNDVLDGT